MNQRQSGGSRFQSALWTFLLFTLVGPFVAAIAAALYTPVAIWANVAPFTVGDHAPYDVSNLPDASGIMQLMAASAISTFVWTPVAAAIAAAGLAGLILAEREFGWAMGGIAAILGFWVTYVVAPFDAGDLLPVFAAAAGAIGAALVVSLRALRVLPATA
ncbi:MAG: hypothetical protein KKB37_10770 [Alphaproteobacteria bacterium]|nr:hypothetical protein [Alphaproteobacteria bacterium]